MERTDLAAKLRSCLHKLGRICDEAVRPGRRGDEAIQSAAAVEGRGMVAHASTAPAVAPETRECSGFSRLAAIAVVTRRYRQSAAEG